MTSLKILFAVILLSAVAAAPAFARVGPSFDCAKASSQIEKTICGSDELAKADADLAAAYNAFSAKLDKPAQEHLAKDELRWIAQRNKQCIGTAALAFDCLKYGYPERIEWLKTLGEGPYPFVSKHVLAKVGTVGKVTYASTAEYPQFDGTGADFSALNKRFADDSAKAIADSVPDGTDNDRKEEWSYDQVLTLQRPCAEAITVVIGYSSFLGGAHPNAGATATLLDLRNGRAAGPDDVFTAGWLDTLMPIVAASLKEEFAKRDIDEALEPAKLGKLLKEPGHYTYYKDRLTISFNRYEVASYASGDFEVNIPYAPLKPLLKPDGPLGSLR